MSAVATFLDPYVTDWLNLLLRWLHVIAAMAWVGASFYFVLLDQSLEAPKTIEDIQDGVGGELWEVHGGGFYHVKKYRVAPPCSRSISPGSNGRRTRPGSPDSRSGRPLLLQCERLPDRPAGGRSGLWEAVGDQHRPAGRSLGRLRRPVPRARRQRPRALGADRRRHRPRRMGLHATCFRRARRSCRWARCSARSWPETCSSTSSRRIGS